MNIQVCSNLWKFGVLLFSFSFAVTASGCEKRIKIDEPLNEFISCLKNQPKKIKGKMCGAYVPWAGKTSELVSCLENNQVSKVSTETDENNSIFEVSAFINCNSGKKVILQFDKEETSKEFAIKSIGEIVY